MEPFFVFTLLASMSLLVMLWTDLKTLEIDGRRNWLMYGVGFTCSLIMPVDAWLVYIGAVFGMVLLGAVIYHVERGIGRTVFAEGDREILAWLVPGLCLGGLWLGAWFLFFMGLGLLAGKWLAKGGEAPGLIVITAAYIMALGFF